MQGRLAKPSNSTNIIIIIIVMFVIIIIINTIIHIVTFRLGGE
jgi:hypothetical protein